MTAHTKNTQADRQIIGCKMIMIKKNLQKTIKSFDMIVILQNLIVYAGTHNQL